MNEKEIASSVPTESTEKLRPLSVDEILATDYGEVKWVVKGLIPFPGITAFSGEPGLGKTWLTLEIARAIARGIPAFGHFETTKGGVLLINEEDPIRLLQERIKQIGIQDGETIYCLSQKGIDIRDKKTVEILINFCVEKGVLLVILDSFVRVHNADENSAREISQVFKAMQAFTKVGISVLFTHHHRKQAEFRASNLSQEMRGSSDILAAIDSHLQLYRAPGDSELLAITQPKSRQGASLKRFEVRVVRDEKGDPRAFEFAGFNEIKPKKAKAEEALEGITELLSEKAIMSRPEIHEELRDDHGKSTIDDSIKLGIEINIIEEVPKVELPEDANRKEKHYRLHSLPASVSAPKPQPSQSPATQGV